METTRTISHCYASSSVVMRPTALVNRLRMPKLAKAPCTPRVRVSVRPMAVSSIHKVDAGAHGLTEHQEETDVIDIPSAEAFNEILDANNGKLVVLMCKATGCRPCKQFRRKFAKLAAHYTDAVFLEIIGDRNDSTRSLMRSLKIRSTPTFVFWRPTEGSASERVHDHSGINADKMLDALKAHVLPTEAGYCEEVKFAAELLAAANDAH